MKSKLIPSLSVAALVLAMTFSVAYAEGVGSGNENAGVKKDNAQTELNGKNDDNRNGDNDSATSTRDNNATSTDREKNRDNDNATSTNGRITSEAHRSAVASFVQSLLSVADREGGIGEQVRVIARAQNDAATTTEKAIEKVESRNALKTLFIGSDYKNLGVLRNEMVKTQNNLDQLKTLLASTTDATDQAIITDQVQVLERVQTNIKNFITAKENSFSLFGWFAKLFAK